MAKINQKTNKSKFALKKCENRSAKLSPILDTKGLLNQSLKVNELAKSNKVKNITLGEYRKTLAKRAKAKYFTLSYVKDLKNLDSPLKKAYNRTYYSCCSQIVQQGNVFTSRYCKSRWCVVCNKMRTAKLISEWKPSIEPLPDKQFVTLTVPNCNADELRDTLKKMKESMKLIARSFKYEKIEFKAISKYESTVNLIRANYHPHIHLIVSGLDVSKKLVDKWLEYNPTAQRYGWDIRKNKYVDLQDIRPVQDDQSLMEIFKYYSKIITSKVIDIKALDVIFTAFQNMRVYQAYGLKRNINEDIDEIESISIDGIELENKVYDWENCDWVCHETGEMLSEYTPDEKTKEFYESLLRSV